MCVLTETKITREKERNLMSSEQLTKKKKGLEYESFSL
jgi:hypothetical protein